jgi:hypothetical protein
MKIRISFLFLLVFLLVPIASYGQSAADKSWSAFWNRFSTAINTKNRSAIRSLARKGFGGECANVSVNEWIAGLDKQRLWNGAQEAARRGTIRYDLGRIPGRVTRDRYLIFGYNKRWYFWCIMGD